MKISRPIFTGTNALNAVGVIVIIYLMLTLGQTVKRNYTLGKQIEQLNAQITLLQVQKDQLSYGIQYYNTDSFRDREARSKLGLQLPGESVVIIPRASPTTAPLADPGKAAAKRSNQAQWFDFLRGRDS